MIIEDAIVVDFAENGLELYVPRYAISRRGFFEESGVVGIKLGEKECELRWPKLQFYPPFQRPGNIFFI